MRRYLLSLAVAMAVVSCADPPSKEIDQAQAAIDHAKAAGADHYARDDLIAAQDALQQANQAVADRDYRLALHHAIQARELAQSAATETADRKTAARAEADAAIGGVVRALDAMRARLKAPESARVPARILNNARRAIASGDESVQEARAAIAANDDSTAVETMNRTMQRLRAVSRELDAAAPPPGRRRH